jgi:hypothetical protein
LATCSVLQIMEGIKECDSYVNKKGVVSTSPSVSGSDNGVPNKAISSQGFVFLFFVFCFFVLCC